MLDGISADKDSSGSILWLCKTARSGSETAKSALTKKSFTGQYKITFQESADKNTKLKAEDIALISDVMEEHGRTPSDKSTLINRLRKFSGLEPETRITGGAGSSLPRSSTHPTSVAQTTTTQHSLN